MRGTTIAMAAAVLIGGSLIARGAHADNPNPCGATSKVMRDACRKAAAEDFSIATGNCVNSSDAGSVKPCKATAKQDLADAKSECADQFKARQDFCSGLGKGPYDPVVDPQTFLSPANVAANPNPLFPLVPGTVWVYKNQSNGETDTVTVTNQTQLIDQVTTIAVHDVVQDAGNVVTEDTIDFFAQQTDGTVWYFGETTQQFENGLLIGIEGTFLAGRDNAKPGIIMKATPMVGDVYRQEFLLGDAEDGAKVISTIASESVPATSCSGTCLETFEFSPLDIGGDENKFYKPGVGMILEVDIEGGARNELISFTPPGP